MSNKRDEFPDKALIASLCVGLMTIIIVIPVMYHRAVQLYRVENNLAPVERRGLFGRYLEEQSVSLSDIGVSSVLWQIVIPALAFFILYIVTARIVQSFCEGTERLFQFASGNDEELMPKGHDFLVVRVVFWPLFLMYGILLIFGALTVFLFKGIWR